LRSTIIYFTNGIDFQVPNGLVSTYFLYLAKSIFFWFLTAIFVTGQYHLGWLLLGIWWGDYQFFKELVDVQLYMEED